jgi:peptidoglycan/xylan/chitin deacetylase (PgdA/CDA1 family)
MKMQQTTSSSAKRIVVTTSWDDNSYENQKVAKLLDEFGMIGTFYVNSYTDNFGRNLNQKHIKEMVLELANSNHEIGSHTVSHAILTKCENPREEIEESKHQLEKLTQREVICFCYPNGAYNDGIKELVKDAGYMCARTCEYGGGGLPKDPYEWGITLHASNGSPRTTFKIWRQSGIPFKSLMDWEVRAKLLFDLILNKGGIWHLWGHAWEIELHKDWEKLTRILRYVSGRKEVLYVENGKIFRNGLTEHRGSL